MAEELDYRRVLRRCISRLKEDLEPDSILDCFTESDYLTSTAIRDIRELPTTTRKNEAIVSIVQTKGIKGYTLFKRFLRKAYQGHLADVLEEMEEKVKQDQQSKSDVRASQGNGVGQTTYNYGGQDSMNVFGGNLNVNRDIYFGGNRAPQTSAHLPRDIPSHYSLLPRYPANYSPRDIAGKVDGRETLNFGGQNAFNVYGGQVNLQGNLHFGGGQHGNLPDQMSQVTLGDTEGRSAGSASQYTEPNYSEPYSQYQPPGPGQHGNIGNLPDKFSQVTLGNTEGRSPGSASQYTEPNYSEPYSQYQPTGPVADGKVQEPPVQPHSELSYSLKSFGQTKAHSTSKQHIGNVPMEEDSRTLPAPSNKEKFNAIVQDQGRDIQNKILQHRMPFRGLTSAQSMSEQHVVKAPVAYVQIAETADLDVSLHDQRHQNSHHQDRSRGERSDDETDAPKQELNTNNDGTESRTFQLPSVSLEQTIEKPQDVDDGRVISVPLWWLNTVLEEEPFSSGKSGDVFKSKDKIPEWKMEIAVKKIPRTKYNKRAAQNEMIAARLRHHGIVPLLGRCLEDKDYYYFVFPYMEHGNLRDAINQDMENEKLRMDVTKRVFILYKIACTILYIHTDVQGLRSEMVHGDITTTNIVLDSNDNPRLLDFGVARSLKGEDFAPVQYGDQIGAYTCTTVVADKRMTLKTDYRSFGVEMLTGEDPKKLKNRKLKNLKKANYPCFQKVWENDEDIYNNLKDIAAKCLDGEVDAEHIAKELCNILNNVIAYEWNIPKDEKCSMCMINSPVNEPDFNLYVENCRGASCRKTVPAVCVACMRNSYLNPIQCLACRRTIHTKIGTCWAAILITGYDKTDQSVFQQDTNLMKKTLTSRYPLITGFSLQNVYCIKMEELENTVKELKNKELIQDVFIYYSGHYYKDEGKGFQTDEHSYIPKGEFAELIKFLEREIILVTDCCFSGDLRDVCPNVMIHIGASGSEETAEFKQSGSVLTQFFVHSLKGVSQGSLCPLTQNLSCDICKKYNTAVIKIGFISAREMFKSIKEHMKEYYKNGLYKGCKPFLSMKNGEDDCFIGYHIDKKTEIKFGIDDNITERKQPAEPIVMSELPEDMKDLQITLFGEVLKQRDIDIDGHQELWDRYFDVITVMVAEGPHLEHQIELCTIANVSAAVIQKFDIHCSFRPIKELNKGKVGMFLTDITTGNVVECVTKTYQDRFNVQRGEKEVVITVDWNKIEDWSVVHAVGGESPTERWLRKCLEQIADIADQHENMEAKELVMTAPFGECNTTCEMAKRFFVIEIRK